MHNIFLNKEGNILNIAHRGASSAFPENTIAAFRAAVEMGADMIELDVRQSKDKVPVVFHDMRLNYCTNEKGYVKDYNAEDLKKVEITLPSDGGPENPRLPLLEDVLAFAGGKIPLNIEIKADAVKNEPENGIEQACLQLLADYNMQDQALISSFDLRAIQRVKQINSEVATAVLYSSSPFREKFPSKTVQQYKADSFHCTYNQLSFEWIEGLKK